MQTTSLVILCERHYTLLENMKLLIIVTLATLTTANIVDNKTKRCNGLIVNGINHEIDILKEHVDKPYMMSIDYDTNVLYYTFTGHQGRFFIPAAINLKTREKFEITGVTGGFTTSVDPKSHKVYIGGSDGIYEFNLQTRTARNLHITDQSIWQVFAKDGIYFTTYPNENAFVYKDGKLDKVAGIGDTRALLVGLDKENNLFFSNSSGLFYRPKNSNVTTHVGDQTVNSFSTDVNEKLHFSTPVGIFSIDVADSVKITKVAGINNIYGAVIESDGAIIYSMDDAIIRLKSTGDECSFFPSSIHPFSI